MGELRSIRAAATPAKGAPTTTPRAYAEITVESTLDPGDMGRKDSALGPCDYFPAGAVRPSTEAAGGQSAKWVARRRLVH